ncbi:hypothetical protein ACI792_04315 [Blastococcus sp. SYSU DS0669]
MTTSLSPRTAPGPAGEAASPTRPTGRPPARPPAAPPPRVLRSWLRAQALNVTRHAAALRPFGPTEFGTGPQAPSPGHVAAVNRLLAQLGTELDSRTTAVGQAARRASSAPTGPALRELVTRTEEAHGAVRATEAVWDWYFEFFGQRQSRYGPWLLACDRIALDVYQDVYMGLGRAKSVPAPPPMSYMRTGFSPATFRRDVRLQRLGSQPNPFPIVQLPYHRLVNPWTLGAILHEISHNLHTELGLSRAVPEALHARLREAGAPPAVAGTWARWNRETFADLLGLLLGGPAIVASLIDILARSPASVTTYSPAGVHPLPLLRTRVSTVLLARMGFPEQARALQAVWDRTYGGVRPAAPEALIRTAPRVVPLVVDTLCYRPFEALGKRSLAQVFSFDHRHEAMVEEAGARLARGIDPGIVPERFLIGAARHALDRRLAPPDVIARHFYRDLGRR